jgi:methionyl-tRNA formyltransferase
MRLILIANWGLGLEILKVLDSMPDITIAIIVTQYNRDSSDVWYNVVHDFAKQKAYPTIIQDALSFSELEELIIKQNIDLLVLHAFMKILPREVYSAPKYGSINIHPSLLPKYRGPSPSYWVIKNKEHITGLTCHYINDGIDTGDIISQVAIEVDTEDTVESIIEKQKGVVKMLLTEALSRIVDTDFRPIPQTSDRACYAPRPKSIRDI